MPPWTCPTCARVFNRANVAHRCGTGDRALLLARKPAPLVALYERLEAAARGFGPVEFVCADRYVLLRTTRVFADVVFMTDALRLALQLDRAFDDEMFFKTVHGASGRVQQVAKLRDAAALDRVLPYLQHAWRYSLPAGSIVSAR
jgi:hypothetical protein